MKLAYAIIAFIVLHILVWFISNSQLINDDWRQKSFLIMLFLSIPVSLCAYYGTRFGYDALGESAWGVRFIGFGTSYLVFPILTYMLLGESMFTLKTMICVILSIIIVTVQIVM